MMAGSNLRRTRDFFLWFMSIVYLFAFSSLYIQIPGLYGDNGILPARHVIKDGELTWQDLMEGQPTLLKLMPRLGLDLQTGMDLMALSGMVISFFCIVSRTARDFVSFTLLWMFYLSLYQVGQTFMWFQWDILLLETGFITIIIAPFNLQMFMRRWSSSNPHDGITMWLARWLLFRLMFASGVVKLTSKCPTWWGLTALNVHFESQCIPTPAAWYWHHLPDWFLQLSVVATYVIEIPIPFLFFSPIRCLRLIAFWAQAEIRKKCGFLSKVQNWHRKVTEGNIAMFTNLSQLLNPEETLSADLQVDIAAHLKSLEDEFKNYFPDLDCGEEAFVRNPFTPGLDITVIANGIQDELLELRYDSSARDTHSFGVQSRNHSLRSAKQHFKSLSICLDLPLRKWIFYPCPTQDKSKEQAGCC